MNKFENLDRVLDGGHAKHSELSDVEAEGMYIATIMEVTVGAMTLDQDIVYSLNPEHKDFKPPTNLVETSSKLVEEPHIVVTHGVQSVLHPFSSHGKHK